VVCGKDKGFGALTDQNVSSGILKKYYFKYNFTKRYSTALYHILRGQIIVFSAGSTIEIKR
jgi:hypothetical protein